ncbi:MAG: 2-dehydropantoate 2-reductase N-terminal domain-containing protein, partial [Phycisphaerae bacterium]
MSAPITRATTIGSGAMGTLCTLLLAERGVRVTLWGASPQRIAVIARDRENRRYLPGHPLPDTITPTADPERALADRPQLIVSAAAEESVVAAPA